MNGDDAGVFDPGGEPGFLQEAVEVLGAVESVGARHLDRDHPIELLVTAEVHPAEVALTQQPDNAERADMLGPHGRDEDRLDEPAMIRKPSEEFLGCRPHSLAGAKT